MKRASDLRGRDYKESKQKHQVVRDKFMGSGNPSLLGSRWNGGELQTNWRNRKESLEGLVGTALWNVHNLS